MGLVFLAGSIQLFLPGVVLLPAGVQLGAGGFKLAVGGGCAGAQLQLSVEELHLQLAQSGLCLGHQLVVAQVRRRNEAVGVHLLFAGIQLILIALQLVLDVVIGVLRFVQRIPQFHIIFVLRLSFIQGFLGVVQRGLRIVQQRVRHFFQVDQQLDLLQLILKFQHLLLAVHQLVGTGLHGVGQVLFLLGQFGFARFQLGLCIVQLLLGIV